MNPFDRHVARGGPGAGRWTWLLSVGLVLLEVAVAIQLVPFLSALNPYNTIAAIGGMVLAIISIFDPTAGVYALLVMAAAPVYTNYGSYHIGLDEVLAGLVLARYLLSMSLRGHARARTPFDPWLLALAAAIAVSVALSPTFVPSLLAATPYLAGIALFFLLTHMASDESEVERIVVALVAGAALAGFVSVLQIVFPSVAWLRPYLADVAYRVSGTMTWPTITGAYCGMAVLLALPRLGSLPGWRRLGLGLAAASAGAGMILSLARGPWVAFVCGLVVWLALSRGRLGGLGWAAGISVAAVGLVAGGTSVVTDRLGTLADPLSDPSGAQRIGVWLSGLKIIQGHPFFGIGPGRIYEVFPAYKSFTSTIATYWHLHNSYLQMWAESGVVAFVAFTGVVVLGVVRSIRAAAATVDVIPRRHLAASAAAMTCFSVAAFTDHNLYDFGFSLFFWSMLACTARLVALSQAAAPALEVVVAGTADGDAAVGAAS